MVKRTILLAVALMLSACGFHLRGHNLKGTGFAFHSIYIHSSSGETPFVVALRRELVLNKLDVTAAAKDADLVLDIVSENVDKQILTLSGSGQVLQYMLYYRVSLRAYDNQQQEWLSAGDISLQRYFPYDNSKVLAKEQEEASLYKDMRLDAVGLVLRRLSFAKPPQPEN